MDLYVSAVSVLLTCVSIFAPDTWCSSLSELWQIACVMVMLPVLLFLAQNCLTIEGPL